MVKGTSPNKMWIDEMASSMRQESMTDDGGAVRRRIESHVQWALRHVFRGRMAVDVKRMETRDEDMVIDVKVRIGKWTDSALDHMNESLSDDDLPPVDQVYACLHELVSIVPRPSVTGPKGPGIFSPMSNDKAVVLSQLLERARELL